MTEEGRVAKLDGLLRKGVGVVYTCGICSASWFPPPSLQRTESLKIL